MNLLRVLILGGTGMLGHKLVQVLGSDPGLDVHTSVRGLPPEAFRIPGVEYHAGVGLEAGSSRLAQVLRSLEPDVVVNAIGAIKQKDLDSFIDETFFLNGSLPHLLPLLNPNRAARVIHFSTDCVFSGDRGNYRESDTPDVVDLYGRSKACGEIDYGPHLTIRTSIIGFELGGHLSLLSWFLKQAPGSVLKGFARAIYSGLPTCTLSRTVREVIREHPDLRGLYHVASEPISKLDLLQRVDAAFGLGHILEPDPKLVIDRSLDDARFRAATLSRRPRWDELVAELVEDFDSLPYATLYPLFHQSRR